MTKPNPILSQLTLTPANFTDTSIVKPKDLPSIQKTSTNFTPTPKFVGSVYTKKSFRFRKGRVFFNLKPPQLTPPPPSADSRPRNPVMSEGRFWRQIFQALRTGLNQLVHLASGSKNRGRPWPRAKRGWNNLGEMGPHAFSSFFCGTVHVRCGGCWDLFCLFWMSKSILSLVMKEVVDLLL